MLTHREFSAWIVVEGKELPEYLVAVDSDANRVSCWIPGEEGQVSSISFRCIVPFLTTFPISRFQYIGRTKEEKWTRADSLLLMGSLYQEDFCSEKGLRVGEE